MYETKEKWNKLYVATNICYIGAYGGGASSWAEEPITAEGTASEGTVCNAITCALSAATSACKSDSAWVAVGVVAVDGNGTEGLDESEGSDEVGMGNSRCCDEDDEWSEDDSEVR